MSANVYSIEDLLIGKSYNSRSVSGVIVGAEKHPADPFYKDAESYLVRIRPNDSLNDTYRSVAVSVG
jgi:hypothetical protein